MKRKILILILFALALVMFEALASAEFELPVVPKMKKATVYLQYPIVERPEFPTVTEENGQVIVSGLSAYGILPEEMLIYDLVQDIDDEGNPFYTLIASNEKEYLDNQIRINSSYAEFMSKYKSRSISCAFQLGEAEGNAHISFDPNQPKISEIQMSYTLGGQDNTCTFTDNKYEITSNNNNKIVVSSEYGNDGWLSSARVQTEKMTCYYKRVSSMSYRYEMTNYFIGDIGYNYYTKEWYYPQTGEKAEAPKGVDPYAIPFELVGDLPEDDQTLSGDGTLLPVKNRNAVSRTWPGGTLLPPLPELEMEEREDCYILTIRGVAAWGADESIQGVWVNQGDDIWKRTGDFAEPDTLILETRNKDYLFFEWEGVGEMQSSVYIDYYFSSESWTISMSDAEWKCIYSTHNRTDQMLAVYETDNEKHVLARYSKGGDLVDYTVDNEDYSYTYTFEPFRGADADHPILMNYDVLETDERYYWREYWGWACWDRETNGWVDCETPEGVERCEPLPLI